MPVQVAPVTLSPVPNSDTYVATIKSRRSSTMQPQVDGNLVKIFVHSGDLVKAGQVLMRIDPLKQVATVQSQQGTQAQKKALYDYTQIQVERQRKLFEAGVVSRDAYDQAIQAFQNAKADYESRKDAAGTRINFSPGIGRRWPRHPMRPCTDTTAQRAARHAGAALGAAGQVDQRSASEPHAGDVPSLRRLC